jgi:hypothetical protein
MRATIQGDKFLTIQLEVGGHQLTFGTRTGISVAGNLSHTRVFENRNVEIDCIFRVVVKP